MMPTQRPSFSVPDLIQCFHIAQLPLFSIFGVLSGIFDDFPNYNKTVVLVVIVGSCLIIYEGLRRFILNRKMYEYDEEEPQKSTAMLTMGWQIGLLMGWAPRLAICMFNFDLEARYYITYVPLFTISAAYNLFITGAKDHVRVVYNTSYHLPVALFALNCAVTALIIVYNRRPEVVAFQYGLFPICTAAMTELGQIMAGNLVEINSQEVVNTPNDSSSN